MDALRMTGRNLSFLAVMATIGTLIACAGDSPTGPAFGKGGGTGGGAPPPPPANPEIAYSIDGRNDQLLVMNADGSNQTSLLSTLFVFHPSWAPGGQRIAAGMGDGTTAMPAGIYIADISIVSGVPRASNTHLVAPNFQQGHPRWSPDGTQLAITGVVGQDLTGLATLPAAGGPLTVHFSATGGGAGGPMVTTPAWSPDGTRIAFVLEYSYPQQYTTYTLMVLTLADDHVETVYAATPSSSVQQLLRPDWSPDGSLLAIDGYSAASGKRRLYTIAPVAGAMPVLLPATDDGYGPRWSPGGDQLVYGKNGGVYRYTMQTAASVLLARSGSNPDWRR